MTRLVILPGTDGTGNLLADIIRALGDLDPLVITYPKEWRQDYGRLAESAESKLPQNESFCLLGESFGGPVAILLAKHRGCVGLILSASFERYSSPLRMLEPLAGIVSPKRLPSHLLSWFLLGKWSNAKLRAELNVALADSSDEILRQRLKASLQVDLSNEVGTLKMPLMYLQASEDRIVPSAIGKRLVASVENASLVRIDGPHMLLQTAPEACAKEIRRFVASL